MKFKDNFEGWFNSFKRDGEHESQELFDSKLFDLFALKNSCEYTWNHQQRKIYELQNALEYSENIACQYTEYYLEAKQKNEQLSSVLDEATNLIRLSQTRLSTTPCENGKTLGENYSDFLAKIKEIKQ